MHDYQPLPWFPFYPNDWTARALKRGLSIPGEGCLIELLGLAWTDKTIPADWTALVVYLRGYNGPGLTEALTSFHPCPSQPGRLYCPELEGIRQESILKHRRRVDAGHKSASKRLSPKLMRESQRPQHVNPVE